MSASRSETEVRPRSWAELNRELFEGSWNAALGRFRSRMAFRGQARADLDLTTGLMELGGDFEKIEPHLLSSFRKYALPDLHWADNEWNWLAVAQHHGLPTRLLDWTFSPYVALHFATADLTAVREDGVVWCVDFVEAHKALPPRLVKLLRRSGSDVFSVELLAEAAPSLSALDRLSRSEFALFWEPPSLDGRVVNQSALFSMLSSAKGLMRDWLSRRTYVCRRIILPSELKWEVRDKLDQSNINERVLLPGWTGSAAGSGATTCRSKDSGTL